MWFLWREAIHASDYDKRTVRIRIKQGNVFACRANGCRISPEASASMF